MCPTMTSLPSVCTAESVTDVPKQIVLGVSEMVDLFGFSTHNQNEIYVTKIIEKVKNRKNLGLFSATISQEVMTVSWMYQRDEVEITVEPKKEDRPDIEQYEFTVDIQT